jgi:RNA polymerase sigma-70 factor (ECF subfamily)
VIWSKSAGPWSIVESEPGRGSPSCFEHGPGSALHEPAVHDLAAIYAAHFLDVGRWVRRLGANSADVEDLTQEVFIIVGRKLDMFDGQNLRGFIYRIAQRTVRDYRESMWYRRSVRSQPAIEWHFLAATEPAELLAVERLHMRRTLGSALARMSEKLRTVLILYEIDGYSGE